MRRNLEILCALFALLIRAEGLDATDFLQKWSGTGYIKYMQTVVALQNNDNWLSNNLLHNRFDVRFDPMSSLNAQFGLRNRAFFGDFVQLMPDFGQSLNQDFGYWRWSRVWADGRSYALHSTIDRAFVDYTYKSLQVRVGRHRINWGMNLIWNPNDIFNTYSLFDFDYEERPGSDAVSLQYYTGATSFCQIVYKQGADRDHSAAAGLYRGNIRGYDVQVLAGTMGRDWVLGCGWSGQIASGGFRGEISQFIPQDDVLDQRKIMVASVSGDFTLRKGLYLHTGVLYNSGGAKGRAGSWNILSEQVLTAKTLSRGRFNLFGQVSFPFTPLITGDCSIIANPDDSSYYLGPSVAFSLSNSVEFFVVGQFFYGEENCEYGGIGKIAYSRLRWSF
jgi:hypothetical protein